MPFACTMYMVRGRSEGDRRPPDVYTVEGVEPFDILTPGEVALVQHAVSVSPELRDARLVVYRLRDHVGDVIRILAPVNDAVVRGSAVELVGTQTSVQLAGVREGAPVDEAIDVVQKIEMSDLPERK